MRTPLKLLITLLLMCAWGAAQAQTCVQGTALTATLTFTAVTLNIDGSPIIAPVSYNLYQGTSPSTLVVVSGVTKPGTGNVINTGLAPGTYYWAVTAVDANGLEGAKSALVCKTFPKPVPGVTTITIT